MSSRQPEPRGSRSHRRFARELLGYGLVSVVALAVDQVWHEIALPDLTASEWRTAATALATELYALLTRHPWLLQAFGSFVVYGPGKARYDDHSIALYEAAGFTGARADQAAQREIDRFPLGAQSVLTHRFGDQLIVDVDVGATHTQTIHSSAGRRRSDRSGGAVIARNRRVGHRRRRSPGRGCRGPCRARRQPAPEP